MRGALLILGPLFLLPFILFGLGIIQATHLVASMVFLLYLCLLIINFEAGFLSLIFIRSSIDYLKHFAGSGDANLAAAVSLVIIVLGVFYVLYQKVNILKFDDSVPFLVFLALCGLSVTYSPAFIESLSDWLRLVSTFAVYILARIIFTTSEKIRRLFIVILLSALMPMMVAVYQLATGNGAVYDAGQHRIVGTFLHPNAFASYLLILLIFCTAQILEKGNFLSRRFMIVLTSSAAILFLFTFSRGAWLVFVFAMILMGFLRYRRILGILPFVLIAAILMVPAVKDRILNVFDAGYTHGRSGWDWRVDTWTQIMDMVRAKPFFGHGLSSVEFHYGILTHNDYLRLIAETGLFGFVAYVFFVIKILVKTWQDFKNAHSNMAKSFQVGLLAVIAAFLVRQFADNTLRNTVMVIYFWIFVAISRNIAALDRTEKQNAIA